MAIETNVGNIMLTGIKNLLVKTKTAPKTVIGDFDTLVDLTLSNEEAKSEKRFGFGAPIRFTLYGETTTILNGTFGAISPELLRVMTGNVITVKNVPVDVIDKGIAINSSTATLTKGTPVIGREITVYVADANGRNKTLLKTGTPATDPTAYSISGTTVTVNVAVTGKLNIYYLTDKEVQVIEAKPSSHAIYELVGIVTGQDVDTGAIYRGSIEIPSAQMSSNYNWGAKNSQDVPDDQTVEITCLHDSTAGYPYRILFEQVADTNF